MATGEADQYNSFCFRCLVLETADMSRRTPLACCRRSSGAVQLGQPQNMLELLENSGHISESVLRLQPLPLAAGRVARYTVRHRIGFGVARWICPHRWPNVPKLWVCGETKSGETDIEGRDFFVVEKSRL